MPNPKREVVYKTKSICPLFAQIIGEKLATLYELETKYTMGDVYIMSEICSVSSANIESAQDAGNSR